MNDPLINRPGGSGTTTIVLGGGDTAVEGLNYIFTGSAPNQVLRIKNLDTALANRIDTVGADGLQAVQLQDGV